MVNFDGRYGCDEGCSIVDVSDSVTQLNRCSRAMWRNFRKTFHCHFNYVFTKKICPFQIELTTTNEKELTRFVWQKLNKKREFKFKYGNCFAQLSPCSWSWKVMWNRNHFSFQLSELIFTQFNFLFNLTDDDNKKKVSLEDNDEDFEKGRISESCRIWMKANFKELESWKSLNSNFRKKFFFVVNFANAETWVILL